MSKNWYILHTYSGYEQKIERTIRRLLSDGELDSNILFDIKIPTQQIIEIRDGKKRSVNQKLLPNYIMLEMDLPDLGWKATCNVIRRIQGVSGFVGTKPDERPRPISSDEAKNLLQQSGDIKGDKAVRVKQSYDIGDRVSIMDGPFKTFSGVIEEINAEKNKLRVNVQIFGRATPVEVDVMQVQKA